MCDLDLDDVCADQPSDVVVTLPAELAAELGRLVPGPLDAAVASILGAWVARCHENFARMRLLNKD